MTKSTKKPLNVCFFEANDGSYGVQLSRNGKILYSAAGYNTKAGAKRSFKALVDAIRFGFIKELKTPIKP